MDRRGRNASGPKGKDYNNQKELDNIYAILKLNDIALIFGHSFGAFASLIAAMDYPLLYGCGLRISEALHLTLQDIAAIAQRLGEEAAQLAVAPSAGVVQQTAKCRSYIDAVCTLFAE